MSRMKYSMKPILPLIREFEGLKLNAYKCSAGVWTIGYGSTRGLSGDKVRPDDTITTLQAEMLLELDLEPFYDRVLELVKVDLTQKQLTALVSLAYNIGLGNFKNSTLLRLLNKGDYTGASDEFPKWRRANGKIVQGLVNRRKKEQQIFMEIL